MTPLTRLGRFPKINFPFIVARGVINTIILITVWLFATLDFDCFKNNDFVCPNYKSTRKMLFSRGYVQATIILCSLLQVMMQVYCYFIYKKAVRDNTIATTNRTLSELLKLGDKQGIEELLGKLHA